MRSYIIISCILLSCFSCRKDNILPGNKTPDIPNPKETIEVIGSGFVIDDNGEGISDAIVMQGTSTVTTNENGYFEMTLKGPASNTVLKVSANGYFTTYPTFIPILGQIHTIQVRMFEKKLSGSLQSADGGIVSLPNGSQIHFEKESFMELNGNKYSGDVHVYSHYIDPTSETLDEQMPGNLSAINEENEEQILQSFAMLNVELETPDGKQLQINKNAELSFVIPSEFLNDAPAQIPLWYFDESSGYWIEEGQASLVNNQYVGEVSHFTFWNCDYPRPLINLTGQFLDPRSTAGAYKVCVTELNFNATVCEYTTLEGFFSGFVPRDLPLQIQVLNLCHNILFDQNIDPQSNDFDLGTIQVNSNGNSNFISSVISGVVVDCVGSPVSNGRVFISWDNDSYQRMLFTNTDGSFETIIENCESTSYIVKAFDYDKNTYSNELTFAIENNMNLGFLTACGNQFDSKVVFDLNPDFNKEIDLRKLTFVPGSGALGSDKYKYVFIDDFGGGNFVYYSVTLYDQEMNLDDPTMGLLYSNKIHGTPDYVMEFSLGLGNIGPLFYGDGIGDEFVFKVSPPNISITEYSSGIQTEYTDGSVIFSGILEQENNGQGTLSGNVFFDENQNGIRDGADYGLEGINVKMISLSGLSINNIETDSDGNWSKLVSSGFYKIAINENDIHFGTINPSLTTGGTPAYVEVLSNEEIQFGNMGYYGDQKTGLNGHLFMDLNGDGMPGGFFEDDAVDVEVVITNSNNESFLVSTDENGEWLIAVEPGEYTVEINESDLPLGFELPNGVSPFIATAKVDEIALTGSIGLLTQ